MKLATFKGGIHTYDGKELTENKQITPYMPKGDMVYPMSQHIGAPATPCVQVGDRVLVGQIIGQAAGFVSANIISSVSGTVKAIEPRSSITGAMQNSVVVENDGKYEAVAGMGTARDYTAMSKEEIIAAVKDAGVVGLGGAGFPAHVKLSPKDPSKIDTIIINAAECEPYLTGDYRAIMERADEMIMGLQIVLSLFNGAKGIIGIEDNKPAAIELLQAKVASVDNIEVMPLKTKYPQGAERNLIFATTGRKINSKMLPADAGCIVDNVNTIIAIYQAVALTTPLTKKVITITGKAAKNPCNVEVPIGTNFAEILEAAGGTNDSLKKIISGGPMMGQAMATVDAPVTKTSTSMLCMDEDEVTETEPSACIHCGRCAAACPENLVPFRLAPLEGKPAKFVAWYGMECTSCGCCSFVCPAKIPLTSKMIARKDEARAYLKSQQEAKK